jgi:hypothetical protein
VLANIPNEILREKVQDTLQMCEVEFAFAENKKDFTSQGIQMPMSTLLKESFAFMIEESEMDLALGALNAGIAAMNLMQRCDSS